MSEPFFSVIIPTYNRAFFIEKALQSVIDQAFTNWEIILIDDASTDNTEEIVKKFSDERIKYFKNIVNIERSASRNRGIDLASGKYICFLDSDDYFLNNRLSVLYNEIEKENFPIALFYTGIVFQTDNTFIEKLYPSDCNLYERIINEIIGTPQVCVHKQILTEHKFNEKYNLAEDLDLWTRIAADYSFIYIKSLTIIAVEHQSRSINSNDNHFFKSLNVISNVLKNKNIRKNIKKNTIQKSLSNIYYKIGIFHIDKKNKIKAFSNLFKSVYVNPFNKRTKHIVVLIIKLIFNVK